jgi:ferredoxin
MSISIDRTRCSGHGLCAELLPELIRLDDWGYPIVQPGPVPEHPGTRGPRGAVDVTAHARRAVAACPALALRLRAGGSQQTPSSGSGTSQGPGR